ncbi:hypothetical protein [Anabaena azotica]|uniref:Uncharacterized protein n=1 Tax=Anabaena azotica FACHB-119 TaxID=947527 RepID=A0ABR8D8T9_9NOST|nr:hypothetical protein [Anabaena azotica]MBD2503620.1 hypothetical protein [Anabaena azotica FACHB-119]
MNADETDFLLHYFNLDTPLQLHSVTCPLLYKNDRPTKKRSPKFIRLGVK